MSTWPEFASLRPPRTDEPPPKWLAALRVYPNAPWVVAEQRRRTERLDDGERAASRERVPRAARGSSSS